MMSMDIAMLLDTDNLDDCTSLSPSHTLYSSPLDPSRISTSSASTSIRREPHKPKTPESRNQLHLVANVAQSLPNPTLTWSTQIQPTNNSRHFIQVSVSPSRGSTRTVIAAHISTPGLNDELLTIPGSTTAAVVSPSRSFYLGKYSPTTSTRSHTSLFVPSATEINDELQWQMYLTPSLSNPLNEMDFDNIQHSPLSLEYPSDPIISTSRPGSVVDPFDVFNSSPYLSKITACNMLNANHHQADDFSANDQTLAIPNGTYAALMELTPPAFDFGSARFSSLEASSASVPDASPASARTPHSRQRGRSPTVSRRGLSGWENDVDSNHSQIPLSVLNNGRKRRRSTPMSPIALRRAYRPSASTPSSNHDENLIHPIHSPPAAGDSKLKKVKSSAPNAKKDLGLESDIDNDDSVFDSDSDDYHPSRSVSPVSKFSARNPTRSLPAKRPHEGSFEEMNRLVSKKKIRRGKGKAKGSAALALAVVTQLGMKSRSHSLSASNGEDGDEVTFDALTLYKQGKTGIRKRKNHPIPLPVPIPNLNKKSRGRKVPYVVADVDSLNSVSRSHSIASSSNSFDMKEGSVEAKAELEGSGAEDFVPQNRRRKGKFSANGAGSQVAHTDEYGGARSYVCVVPGCGKCFVRGEHLKRHVRSIHTHDKPHPCPYEGCDKSFSRRDNLGQHVRIHLQP